MTVVVDADVLIGALDAGDAHHAEARTRFERWERAGEQRVMTLPTMSEVLVAPAAAGEARLRQTRESLTALGMVVRTPNVAIAVMAARLRAAHGISIPDAYALATARHIGAELVTFDARLQAVAAA